jgi:hypothetical protein
MKRGYFSRQINKKHTNTVIGAVSSHLISKYVMGEGISKTLFFPQKWQYKNKNDYTLHTL